MKVITQQAVSQGIYEGMDVYGVPLQKVAVVFRLKEDVLAIDPAVGRHSAIYVVATAGIQRGFSDVHPAIYGETNEWGRKLTGLLGVTPLVQKIRAFPSVMSYLAD